MANGTVTDEEEIDLQDEEQGQNFRQPNLPPRVVAPPTVAAAPTMVAPPGQTPIAPPPIAGSTGITLPSPAEAEARRAIRQMQYAVADMPLAQAQQAVAAAQRFQAQRGYQRDIAGGMSAVDAMVKWGPVMFGSTAGSANALARVAVAAQPETDRVMGAGGKIFRVPKTGPAVEITSPSAPAMTQLDKTKLGDLVSNSRAIRRRFAAGTGTDQDRADLEANLNEERTILNRYQQRTQSPQAGVAAPTGAATPVAAPARPAPAAVPTVIRKTKDGRRAVFDASTRQFIRYADGQ